MNDIKPLSDCVKWLQELDSTLDFVETQCRKLHLNPSIPLKKDHYYCIEVTENTFTIYESIAHSNYNQNSGTIQ